MDKSFLQNFTLWTAFFKLFRKHCIFWNMHKNTNLLFWYYIVIYSCKMFIPFWSSNKKVKNFYTTKHSLDEEIQKDYNIYEVVCIDFACFMVFKALKHKKAFQVFIVILLLKRIIRTEEYKIWPTLTFFKYKRNPNGMNSFFDFVAFSDLAFCSLWIKNYDINT